MVKESGRVLHIFNDPKFSVQYFEFLSDLGFDLSDHRVFHYRTSPGDYPLDYVDVVHSKSFVNLRKNVELLSMIRRSDKVIVHCLAAPFLLLYLAAFPEIGKNVFWVIWGKDLYFYKMLENKKIYHRIYELLRQGAIKNISNVITDNQGDYSLLQEWYGVTPTLYRSFSYPSNLYKDPKTYDIENDGVTRILIGNSADPSNEHVSIFEILEEYKDEKIEVIAPLSYGDRRYAQKISSLGAQMFGEKFIALMEMIPFDIYSRLLSSIDIAVFAHKRQQAMGNIISLLGMGKKVYIRSDISTWESLSRYGLLLGDVEKFDLEKAGEVGRENNIRIVKKVYSKENLAAQWKKIFDA